MKKQVVLYTDTDTWECKDCIFSEIVTTERLWEFVFICHKNRMKFSEETCIDRMTNNQLVKKIKKEEDRP
jgi:hypothetical protein